MSSNQWHTPVPNPAGHSFPLWLSIALFSLTGCGHADNAAVLRLVDLFTEDMVRNTPTKIVRGGETDAWNFAEPPEAPRASPTLGWKAGAGVSGLRVRDGRLTGRTTTATPILYLERTAGLDNADVLHAIEVRARASEGENLMAHVQGAGDLDFEAMAGRMRRMSQPWQFTTPLIPGDNLQTITLRTSRSIRMSGIHKIFIRPTDAKGAQFEIESVRLISRQQHLARIPSGVGWQGLGEIYHESLVSRAPESIEMEAGLPARAWLDLHVGTVNDSPVTFTVRLGEPGSKAAGGTVLLQRTVTTPDRWEATPIDLSAHGGSTVTLSLSLSAVEPGALGFWGTAAIRTREGQSPRATQPLSADLGAGNRAPQGVILVVADTLRRDHLNPWGHGRQTVPALAGLVSEGALFLDNISQASWTKASVPAILSSLYPSSSRVKQTADRLPAAATTLAEVYHEAGYATVSYASNQFTGKFTNLHQGFEELHERASFPNDSFAGMYRSKTARDCVDRAADWIEAHREEPFFVFLHVLDPHSPFEPRRPYSTVWSGAAGRDEFDKSVEQVRKAIAVSNMKAQVTPTADEVRESGIDRDAFLSYTKGWYDGSILGMDAEIARLMERLGGLGLADKTLLAFTSDHGEGFQEHNYMWHGQTIYGESGYPLYSSWRTGAWQ